MRAALVHLVLSAAVAAAVALLVFRLWYPPPYAAIAGGTGLFLLLVAVDVCLGPALTAVVAAPGKPLPELRRDLAVIVAVQLAGLAYGVYTLALARPVHLSFEIDRFRVIAAADVDDAMLLDAPAELRGLPWFGPTLIAAVKPTDPVEQLRALELALSGFDLSYVPRNWRPYTDEAPKAWQKASPVARLLAHRPDQASALTDAAQRAGLDPASLRFLPLVARRASWTVLLAGPDARPVGYLPVDAFF